MNKIIKELFDGSLDSCTGQYRPQPEYQNAVTEVEKKEAILLCSLNEEQKKLYEDVKEKLYELERIGEIESFQDGLQFGVKFMIEVLD